MSSSVLVIDDDAELRDMLKLVLEFEGFQVYCAADGVEGLKALEEFPDIQAILLDLMMPIMNGFQFLERLEKREKPPIPVIVLTAAERSLLKHPILKRVRKIAQKPFKVEELIFTLKEMMRPEPWPKASAR